jgi:hypothetical protein
MLGTHSDCAHRLQKVSNMGWLALYRAKLRSGYRSNWDVDANGFPKWPFLVRLARIRMRSKYRQNLDLTKKSTMWYSAFFQCMMPKVQIAIESPLISTPSDNSVSCCFSIHRRIVDDRQEETRHFCVSSKCVSCS